MVITYDKGKDQPGKAANPTRGQLNMENDFFPVTICASEFCLAIRVRQSVPSRVSLLFFSILRLNLVLTYGTPPDFRGASIYLFKWRRMDDESRR